MSPFVHLHLHSHFSFLRSSIRLKQLCEHAASAGMTAVALTDDANLFGAPQFCREARAAGLKPILGCDLYVTRGDMKEGRQAVREREWLRRLPATVAGARVYLDASNRDEAEAQSTWAAASAAALRLQELGGLPVLSRSQDTSGIQPLKGIPS